MIYHEWPDVVSRPPSPSRFLDKSSVGPSIYTQWITRDGMLFVALNEYIPFIFYLYSLSLFAQESENFESPQRGPDGRYLPVEQITPMDESFIGGFHPHIPSRAPSPAPPLPPKDRIQPGFNSSQGSQLTMSSSEMTHLSAIERSKLLRVARMNPHLQVYRTKSSPFCAHKTIILVHGWPSPTVRRVVADQF